MKNNFLSKAYGGVTVARRKLNGLGLPRQWKVMTSTLLLLFTFAIGNVWAADPTTTIEFKNSGSITSKYIYEATVDDDADLLVGGKAYFGSVNGTGVSDGNVYIYRMAVVFQLKSSAQISITLPSASNNKTYTFKSFSGNVNYNTLIKNAVGGDVTTKLASYSSADPGSVEADIYEAYNGKGYKNLLLNDTPVLTELGSVTGTATKNAVLGPLDLKSGETSTTFAAGYYALYLDYASTTGRIGSLTLTPVATGYSITYHCNGATSGCPSDVASGATALPSTLATPEKTGFVFDKWYTDEGLTTPATAGATLTANANLYAGWIAAGSAYDVNIASMTNGSVVASPTSQVEDGTVTLTVTPDDGYLLSSLSVVGDVSGDEVTVTANQFTMPAEDVTINATFSLAPTYTVTLNPAGGTIVDATGWTLNAGNYEKEVAEGTVLTLPTFTKTDRAFKTWRKAGPADVESPVTVTGDLTLTAVWNATVENVIYSWEGAEGGATEVGGTAVGSAENMINQESGGYYCLKVDGKADWSTTNISITLSGSEKVKTGDKIKFTAFYNKSKNGEAQAANSSLKMFTATTSGTQIFDMGNSELLPNIYGGGNDPANYTKTVPAGIDVSTVYMTRSQTGSNAWISKLQIIREVQVEEGDLLTVTLDYNDGATPNGSIMVASGQAVAQPANPTWAHHRFNGWKLGGSAYDFSSAVTTDITLVANWTQLYTITYAAGDGTATGDAPTQADKAATETFTVAANSFEVAGKDFVKWNDGTNDYAPGATYTVGTDNVVLTAQWEAQASNDATLKALSVAGLTLAPVFAAETETYTVTKEYGAADPVVGDVTATPAADGADVDVAWDGTNKKFTITVTALDNTTEKTYTITVNEAEAPKSLSRVLFSNGFDAFIDNTNHTVKAYYLSGAAEPTATSITAGDGTAGALSEGKIRVTGADDSYVDYVVTLEAVTPNTTTVAEEAAAGEFAGDEAWVKNGLLVYGNAAGYSAGDKWYVNRRLTKGTDPEDDQRVIAGWVRSYFFVGNASKFIMTIGGNKKLDYTIDGGTPVENVEVETLEIALTKGNHMIEIVSHQQSGDCRLSAPKLVELPPSHTVTYKPGEGSGAWVVDADAIEVADVPGTFTAPTGQVFNGWKDELDNDVEVGAIVSADMALTAQWINHYAVTFNMNGHGDAIDLQDIKEGAKATKPDDPVAIGFDFGGWFTDEECTAGNEFDFNISITAATPLYAKWTEDPCPTPFSLSKVVLTSASDGTVTGYNNNEYAGEKVIGGLSSTETAEVDPSHEGAETGYKLNSGGSAIVFATLKKGTFQEGDRVVVTITKKQDAYKVEEVAQPILDIYYGTDKNDATFLTTLEGVSAAGTYTYRLTAADVTAIGTKKGIGVFRPNSGRTQNPYIYSVEIQGCRSWAVFHTLTFKNIDGTATIADESLEEGAAASTVAPAAPKIATKRFLGWAEATDGTPIDLTSYTITEDKTLYAVYEDIVCPTSGTVYKFQLKTDLTNGNVFATAPNSVQATTDNYLSELVGGEVTFSVTGTNNNRIQFYDQKAVGFASGSGGQITMTLECPLKENDEIRFINYASSGNRMTLSDGTNSTTLDGNGKTDVQTFVVPAAWETTGSYELTLVRNNNTAKLTYFEIYRRPEVTGVTVADFTIREGASTIPTMTLSPSDDARVTSQVWSIVSGDDKIDIDPATGEVTGVAAGDAEATVHVVETFVQEDVTESITWDFSKAGVVSSAFSEQVLANVDGVTLDASQFEATKLVGSANNITNTYFQGTMLTFNATKAGLLNVRFTNGNGNVRTLKVYVGDPEVEIASWSYSNAAVENKFIEVPAGKVTLRSYQETSPNNVRIMNLEFLAVGHERTLVVGDLGTVCLPNASIARGVTVYEYQGADEIGKIVFEELGANELLAAGKPYIFQVNETNARFYYNTDPAVADPDNSTALKGNLGATITFEPGTAEAANVYFVKDHAFWMAKNTGVKIGQYRAYLQMDEVTAVTSSTPAPGRRRITLGVQGEQVATGLENGELNEAPRKVLINGELFILRGEKMYDAKGQLVK